VTKVTFLGGTQRVGASGVLVEQADSRLLMDYGAAFDGSHQTPLPTSTRNLIVALSHAHLDHSGSLPIIAGSYGHQVPVYMTPLTRSLLQILLADMLQIGEDTLAFEKLEVRRLMRNIRTVNYGQTISVGRHMRVALRNAGHIPGSASLLVETTPNGGPGARILYTGDVNTVDTELVQGAPSLRDLGELDLIIIESTYAREDHVPRVEMERSFIAAVRDVVEQGGTALVPCFAVGRAQEILCVLEKHSRRSFEPPIFMDGMARSVTSTLLRNPGAFKGGSLLKESEARITYVRSERDRQKALEEPAVIVSPAGMLKGGAAPHYLRAIAEDEHSGIFLVGKQLPGTPGAALLETGEFADRRRGRTALHLKVKAAVRSFDFSGHAGRSELLSYASQAQGNPKILTMHGDPQSCQSLAESLRTNYGYEATAAVQGQTISLA
jgi:putative mRNA 3-end processing factor